MTKVRVRFAPSPTGFLHIGGIRTALFNYLFAKSQGGRFILRLEDTDRERFVEAGVKQIVEGLEWIGLVPDEGFWISQGQHQNLEYVQSERHKQGSYQKWADQLVEQGLAYYSQISPEDYAELKASSPQPFAYRRSLETGGDDKAAKPIRLDIMAATQKLGPGLGWRDLARGEFNQALELVEDFILIKSDGYPTYNFANVIDDHDMAISHVIRGDEFIASTIKHAILYDLFGWPRPNFVHLPVINGSDGKKLSKRTGDTNVLDYRDQGYLPEALINFLVLLGWNPGAGETQEIFDLGELVKRFSLEQVQKSPAVFDIERLNWMNGEYIRAMTPEQLLDRLIQFLNEDPLAAKLKRDRSYSLGAVALVQERMKRLDEANELLGFFFNDPDPKQLDFGKIKPAEAKHYLELTYQMLSANSKAFDDATDIERLMREVVLPQTGQKPGPVFMSVRIAITGLQATPGLFETMVALGEKTVLHRLESANKAL